MNQEQAIAVLIEVAHAALRAGVFKNFDETDAVKQAVSIFVQKPEEPAEDKSEK